MYAVCMIGTDVVITKHDVSYSLSPKSETECSKCNVKYLLQGSKANATNDWDKAHPLVGGDLLSVDECSDDGCECRLSGFHDLAESDATGSKCEDGSSVCSGRANTGRNHLEEIGKSDLRSFASIGGDPKEHCVDDTDGELCCGDSHSEIGSTRRIGGILVLDIVIIITQVPIRWKRSRRYCR